MTDTETLQSSTDADTQAIMAEIDASEAAEAASNASKSTKNAETATRGAEEKSAEQIENDSAPEKGADDKSDTPAAKADEIQKTLKASKAEREQQRLDKTWENANAIKDQNAAEKEQIAREREEIQRQREEINKSKPKEFGPEDFTNAATSWDKKAEALETDGKYTEAAEYRALAKQAREEAKVIAADQAARPKTPQTLTPSKENVELTKAVAASWEKAKVEHPDILAQGSPHNTEFVSFVKANPDVLEHPNGPLLVAQHVSFKLQAARVPDLQKQVESLNQKIRSLEALASPAPGGVARSTETKSFADLSLADQAKQLEAELG